MSALGAHLRKEYRDHRSGVCGLFAVIFVAGPLYCLVVDAYQVQQSFLSHLTIGAALMAIILLAPDLSEQRQNTLRFAARLPHGLQVAFLGKMLFLFSAVIGLTCFAFALALALQTLLDVAWPLWSYRFAPGLFEFTLHLSGLALWLVAASFWLQRSTVAVPLVGLLLIAIFAPAHMILDDLPRTAPPRSDIFWWASVLHPLIAGIAAWWSCVGGRHKGRGPGSSAWRGGSIAIACGAVLTGTAEWAHSSWFWFEPTPENITIDKARVSRNGQFAYLQVGAQPVRRKQSSRALILDLKEQTIQELGGARRYATLVPLEHREYAHWPSAPDNGLIACMSAGTDKRKLDELRVELIETDTGRVLGPVPVLVAQHSYGDFGERCSAALRQTAALILPDGRRCWSFRGAILTDDGDRVRTLLKPSKGERFGAFGWQFGFAVLDLNRTQPNGVGRVFDLIRERAFDVTDRRWRRALVLPEHWIVAQQRRNAPTRWLCFDPERDQTSSAPGMVDGDRVCHVFRNGTLLVQAETGLHRIDTGTGDRTQLAIEIPLPSRKAQLHVQAVTPGGRILAMVGGYLTSLARDSREFTRPRLHDYRGIAAIPTETTVIAIVGPNQLVRFDVETGERETLFPFDPKKSRGRNR